MRARLTGFAAGLALVLAPAASAQTTPTPSPTATATPSPTATATPTPEPTPTPEEKQDAKDRKRKDVRRIYRDFERDGRIDDCDHTEKALKIARRSISDSYKEDFPDFREALTAAIERHRDGKCVEPTPTPSATATPAPTTSPGTTTPAPTSTPAPAAPAPSSSPESGTLPDFGAGGDSGGGSGGSGGDSDPGTLPAPGEDAIPEGTASPSATPAPAPAPLPPKLVVTKAATDPNLFAPGVMLAIALLGLLFAALTALFAKRTGRLQGVDQAWREAAWRLSGTWGDFSDWLRRR
jgi:hypothetical protein